MAAMAEPACLRRSLSNPSEISLNSFQQEADPLRALGESISFGRYMSESLAWEKWSTFPNNRYLEEAEKQSKPGSVAKMKAYFEAHYKRKGAKKLAAQEQLDNEPSDLELEVQNTIENSPSLTTKKSLANDHTLTYESPRKETPDVEVVSSLIVSSCDSFTPIDELQEKEVIIVESGVKVDTTENSAEVQVHQCKVAEVDVSLSESSTQIQSNQCLDAQESDIIVCTPEKNLPVKKELKRENLNSKSKQKSVDSSFKKSMKSNVSKLSSSIARLSTPIRPKMEGSGTPSNRKLGNESLDKKKPTSRLVHMTINSDVKKNSPAPHKTGIAKVFTPLGKIIKERFTPSPAPSRASVNSVARHPYATPLSETRRSKIALEKSFSRSRTLELKFQSSSAGNINSAVQSPTAFSSFTFRTEERAAKRREFFQKRFEKEAENRQLLEKAKVKPKTDSRKAYQLENLRANAFPSIKTEVLGDNTKKITSTRSQLPKCGTKLTPELARGTCPRPPQRSISIQTGTEKSKQSPFPTKMNRHENASPNIL